MPSPLPTLFSDPSVLNALLHAIDNQACPWVLLLAVLILVGRYIPRDVARRLRRMSLAGLRVADALDTPPKAVGPRGPRRR
ncbi:MAG TPA: hypothetical protein DCQ33_08345 [Nitrospira sp.]|nr:hypothetical protein [Nitrospira sp.]